MLLIVLLLAGIVFTAGLDRVVDLGLYDESKYLAQGLAAPAAWPGAQQAPLYAVWYLVLSWLQPDAVKLYYLNYLVVTCLLPLALFVALRSYRVGRAAAFLLALGLLLCRANLPVWPKVGHAALVILLAGLAVTSRARRSRTRAAALAAAALLTSYVRPEMYLSFLGLTGLTGWLTWRTVRRRDDDGDWRVDVLPFAALLAAAVALALAWGVPPGSGGRSLIAFGQHYSIHWVRWNHDPRDPWTHWKQIVESDFGELGNLTGPISLVKSNPGAVARHVAANLRALPATLSRLFGSFHPASRPALLVPILALLLWYLVKRVRGGEVSAGAVRHRARYDRGSDATPCASERSCWYRGSSTQC